MRSSTGSSGVAAGTSVFARLAGAGCRGGRVLARSLPALGIAAVLAAPVRAQDVAGLGEELRSQFEGTARKLVALAEAMPAESYSWRPMEGVYTVAAAYMHVARYNYMYPDMHLGVEPPAGVDYDSLEERVTAKREAVGILSASMDHVRALMDSMSGTELTRRTELYGREVERWAVLLQLVTHMNEHLGQAIAYARANRVVPPWSR